MQVVRRFGLSLKRSLGQNFLIDENILSKIVCAVDPRDTDRIVEIGPGIGTLTVALAPLCRQVVALEFDRSLIPVVVAHTSSFGNVRVIRADAARVDFCSVLNGVEPVGESRDRMMGLPRRAGGVSREGGDEAPHEVHRWKVVSNLPYYATSPIIMNVLSSKGLFSRLVFMVQKEVSHRIVAGPGDDAYGAFSIACQYWTRPRVYSAVPRTAFTPAPEVDSAIVVMDVREAPCESVTNGPIDEDLFFRVVRAAFAQRRKTLVAALGAAFGRESVMRALHAAGIEPTRRAETLSIPEFAGLARALGTEFAKGKPQC